LTKKKKVGERLTKKQKQNKHKSQTQKTNTKDKHTKHYQSARSQLGEGLQPPFLAVEA
jgi:hypothetical protein